MGKRPACGRGRSSRSVRNWRTGIHRIVRGGHGCKPPHRYGESSGAAGCARVYGICPSAKVRPSGRIVSDGVLMKLALIVVSTIAVSAQSSLPSQDAAAEVLALEKKIEEAVVRGDVAFIDRVLASDFSFVHGDGWTTGGKPLATDDKAAFLKRVESKEYLVHDLDGVKTEVHG